MIYYDKCNIKTYPNNISSSTFPRSQFGVITSKICKCEKGVKPDIRNHMNDVVMKMNGYFKILSLSIITLYNVSTLRVITAIICRCKPNSETYTRALFQLFYGGNE